ncbi:hypothetical protein GQ55_1G426100 [Panicum hallii var. hallii]|uniref:Uncharacterized protein n=1 Tax=Panicum hallii var. hallii TaxID=1504633 RepID=A0A2T7FDE9_9POAL|nr:hypothetical protein GQ55_1G426100 [Panicum hallii var. hallii]
MAAKSPLSARSGAGESDADATSAPTAGPIRTGPTNTSLLKRTSASTAAAHPSPTSGSLSFASTAENTPCCSSARWSRGSNRPTDSSRASSSPRRARAASAPPPSGRRSAATRRAMVSRSIHAWISPATAPATRAIPLRAPHRRHRARKDPITPVPHRSTEHERALSR